MIYLLFTFFLLYHVAKFWSYYNNIRYKISTIPMSRKLIPKSNIHNKENIRINSHFNNTILELFCRVPTLESREKLCTKKEMREIRGLINRKRKRSNEKIQLSRHLRMKSNLVVWLSNFFNRFLWAFWNQIIVWLIAIKLLFQIKIKKQNFPFELQNEIHNNKVGIKACGRSQTNPPTVSIKPFLTSKHTKKIKRTNIDGVLGV